MSADANIARHLGRMAAERPQQLAVVYPARRARDGRVAYTHLTYRQLDDESTRVAALLRAGGIAPGHRVVLMAPPSLPFFALTFALFKLRALPVFIDPGMGLRSLKRCLREAAPQGFVGVFKAHVARVLLGWERGRPLHLVQIGEAPFGRRLPGVRDLADLARAAATRAPVADRDGAAAGAAAAPDDPAAILFTSGSTGPAKGALYTHANFNAQVDLLRDTYGIEPGEIDLCTFPLFALFAPALGMTAIVPAMDFTRPARVVPERIFEAVADFEVTNLFGSPALLRAVAARGRALGVTMPSLRRVISAGAPVSARILRDMTALLAPGVEIFTPYGATEALPVASLGSATILGETAPHTDRGRGVCIGRPVRGVEVRIAPISDAPMPELAAAAALPPGAIGEIVVSGPQVAAAYFGRPAADALAKTRDPATGALMHRMGDLGYLDLDGRLWFCGRKSHRLRTAAGEMYTIPCEAVFNAHADVYRSALVGRGVAGAMEPVLCVETARRLPRRHLERLRTELLRLALSFGHTATIREVRFFKALPVDTRHNAKIFREKLKTRLDGAGARPA